MLKIKSNYPLITETERAYQCFDENDNVLFNHESLTTDMKLRNGDTIVHTDNDVKTFYSVLKLRSSGATNSVILLKANK